MKMSRPFCVEGGALMRSIGFIGMGNMASAMLYGMLHIFEKEEIVFTRADKSKMEAFSREQGIDCAENNAECAKMVKYLILAIKPQYFSIVLSEIKDVLTPEHVVISIAAGITVEDLRTQLGGGVRIVRAMPNTPALLGEGMTGVCYNREEFSNEEIQVLHSIFESFGKMSVIEERLMNTVVCASGSSPAYVYLFIEALADSSVKYGLPRDLAYQFAAQAVLGAAKMVLETGEHPGVLKDKVCSPGGTTIAGISALEEYGFRNAVMKAGDRCYEKAEELNTKK